MIKFSASLFVPSERDVLEECHGAGHRSVGGFLLSQHAYDRMLERRIKRAEVARALVDATEARNQGDGTWKVSGGDDTDGVPLTLIVALVDGLLIITIF